MSKASYDPPSLTGNPTLALVPPGSCQFTDEFKPVPLLERVRVSPTSSVLRFGLPDKSLPLNLSTCACILARAKLPYDAKKDSSKTDKGKDGELEDVIRPYTPISTNELKGCFDLLIKDYGEDGRMSRYMCHDMNVGDEIDFKHIEFNVKIQAPFKQKTICMLVGGTGITPMIQALHAILGDNDASSNVVMLYGNKSSNDILGKSMIDSWAKQFGDQFKVHHVLSNEPEDSDWKGKRGFITRELIEENVPGPEAGDDLIFFICGPPPMYNALSGPRGEVEISGLLKEMGYKKEQVYKF
ncbi:oxidoreductase FAD/NADP-binding domain containing protein [Nitzschia inconspicua]|uniref:cytochrome-b5 reductase n=1 Tax=Nitzschia inconspicua TaxID=303405 RepID=A0A9K3KKS9_9STRA|nr:oxidoreductase FAD/NADP-binding domain containing protein [Nitzschia inconspicua]